MRRGVAVYRYVVAVALATTLTVGLVLPAVSSATDGRALVGSRRSVRVAHRAGVHRPGVARRAAVDIPSLLCGLLKKPVAAAVNDLVALLTDNKIKGTLVGTIVAEVGFKPFCIGRLQKLEAVIKRARPLVPSRIQSVLAGPLATNVYVTHAPYYGIGSLSEPHWTEYPRGVTLWHKIMLSENGSAYFDVTWSHFPRLVYRGRTAQFAIQLHDAYGHYSPWAFSPLFEVR